MALVILLAIHSLALVGLVGYGLATDRFDEQKRAQYLATWKGEKLMPPPPEVVEEKKEETPQEASSSILAAQQEREVLTREMQLFAQLLRDREVAVQTAQDKLRKDLEVLQDEQKRFAALVAEHRQKTQQENFKKVLRNYASMRPTYVKEDFVKMEDTDVVRYLAEMKTETATAILEQFKTPEEQTKRLRLMKLLEQYGTVDPTLENKPEGNLISQN